MTAQAVSKALSAAVRKAAQPDAAQLEAINRYALEPQTADAVYVRTAWAGHTAIDRDGEVIDPQLLADIARTLPGKGLHRRHPGGYDGDSGPGVGRIIAARVVQMSADDARIALRQPDLTLVPGDEHVSLLEVDFFIPRTDNHAGLLADMDAGVAGDVSLGFRHKTWSDIADTDGNRIAKRLHGPGEGLELSLVWLGAQPGARVHKAATGGAPIQNEERNMELQKQFDTLQADHKAVQQQLADAAKKATGFDAIKAVVGDLAEDPAALKAVIADGTAYKNGLLEAVIKSERLLGLIGDSAEDVAAAKAQYQDMPATKLAALGERLQKMVDAGGAEPEGSDPNAAKPAGDATKGAETTASPVANPMLKSA